LKGYNVNNGKLVSEIQPSNLIPIKCAHNSCLGMYNVDEEVRRIVARFRSDLLEINLQNLSTMHPVFSTPKYEPNVSLALRHIR
jgi:hypothetical protein